MSIERSLIFVFFLSLVGPVVAQTEQKDILEQSIEVIAEANEDTEVDYTTLVDVLTYRLEHPLDINTATREDFLELGVLTEIQVNRILDHRASYGRFIAVEELQAVADLPWSTVLIIRNFTGVSRDVDDLSISLKEIMEYGEHELFLRTDRILEEVQGASDISEEELAENPNRRFLGDQWRYYTRYRFKYQNRLSIGFTAEKDAGEEFFKGSQKDGFDYYSFHAYVSKVGVIDKAVVGDYQIQMGQGLTMWSGLAFGKSANLYSIKRNARGVVPYRSVDENNFLRGAAVSLRRDKWTMTFFGSKKRRDANILGIDTLDVEQALSFSALQINGFHRTPGELADKNALGEVIYGGELKWSGDALSVGVRGAGLEFDKALTPRPNDYNQFFFRDKNLSLVGADYDYVKGNLNIFGEISRSDNGALAYVNGAYLVLDPRITIAALHRNIAKDFQAIYSNPILEGSRVSNERGLFLGAIIRPTQKWTVNAWMDRFEFPWLRFQVDAPSSGHELMGQVSYRPNKKFETYFRYRYRDRPKNADIAELSIDRVGQTIQRNYRVNTKYDISESVELRTRIELTDYQREGRSMTSRGTILYQDILYRPKDLPVDLTFRYALFDTDDYDSRLYAFEQDVLYFYSIPAYSGRGARYYVVTRIKVMKDLDFYLKLARWNYRDRSSISSGLTAIEGNTRTDLRMQIRWQF